MEHGVQVNIADRRGVGEENTSSLSASMCELPMDVEEELVEVVAEEFWRWPLLLNLYGPCWGGEQQMGSMEAAGVSLAVKVTTSSI